MPSKQELQRLLDLLETAQDPLFRNEAQLELAEALKMIRPVYVTTRDSELEQLLKEAEHCFDNREP